MSPDELRRIASVWRAFADEARANGWTGPVVDRKLARAAELEAEAEAKR